MESFAPKTPEQGISWAKALVHSNYTSTGTTLPHRELLTESQRLSLQTPASDERGRVRHYTLSSEDLALINRRRGDPNRLGFALILCYLRFPGRILQQGEQPPAALCAFVAEQLSLAATQFGDYAKREALLHDSTAARVGALFQLLVQDTTAQDFGLPSSAIRLRM